MGTLIVTRPRLTLRRPSLHRFLRPLPAIYLSLLVASVIGGVMYAPNNYDMLTYRLPRIDHWLADGRWHWIHTYIPRMNYSGTGWEWMSIPLLLLTHNTRLLFLLNIVSYALLPGLTFSFLRSFGVSGRVAWHWMWLLPTGLVFATQAGGGGNDAMGVPLVLAAIVLAMRARRSRQFADVFWSALAAALLTATKASNLFLMLPCAIALLPSATVLLRHRLKTVAALPVIVLSSLAPLLLLNHAHTGDFAGSPNDEGRLKLHNPLAGIIGNAIQIGWWNLEPPVLPGAQKIDDLVQSHLPTTVVTLLARDFPRFSMHVGELPQEEGSGLGLAITVMALLPIAASVGRRRARCDHCCTPMTALVLTGGSVALVAFMCTLGSESAARLATPYCPFLLAAVLLLPSNVALAHSRLWQRLAVLAAVSVWPAMILTPSRPLFPAAWLMSRLAAAHPHSAAVRRAAAVYTTYQARPDNLSALRSLMPDRAGTIALLCSDDDSEVSLWRSSNPHRRVSQICPGNIPEQLRSCESGWLVTSDIGLQQQGLTLPQLLTASGGHLVAQRSIVSKVSQGPALWSVIRLQP